MKNLSRCRAAREAAEAAVREGDTWGALEAVIEAVAIPRCKRDGFELTVLLTPKAELPGDNLLVPDIVLFLMCKPINVHKPACS